MDDHKAIGSAGASKAASTTHPGELCRRSQASWPIDRHGLGDVTVQDIPFEIEANEDGNWPSFTVYYDRESNSD